LLDMDDVYADFITEVLAGGFTVPPAGGWSAEQIAAHVARNHEELIRTTEAVLSGEEDASYDNRDAIDLRELDRYVVAYHGLRGLADRLAETVVTLRELSGRLAEREPVPVPVRIQDGGRVVVDQPLPWADVLETDENVHVRRHLDQLRSLRAT
jgi:hypothetical protein